MKLNFVVKILTITLFIAACSSGSPELDISQSKIKLDVKRLEMDLFSDPSSELNMQLYTRLRENYGSFFNLFVEKIISVGSARDSSTLYYLNHFRNDLQVREIAGKCIQSYPDFKEINTSFSDAFSRYDLLFPGKVIPSVYSFISAFSYTIVVDDSILAFGLDMYLGAENDYYRLLHIPSYKSQNMNRQNIVPDCMRSWLMTEFELNSMNSDLLSHMIYHGKILYALDLLLPGIPDSVKIGYSAEQIKWVEENEKDMWFHFAENELLYEKDGKQIQKYIGEGPFTPGFPEGSPGMAGRWVGWQIVRNYMNNTDVLKLKELFEEKDAQKILKLSKYKAT